MYGWGARSTVYVSCKQLYLFFLIQASIWPDTSHKNGLSNYVFLASLFQVLSHWSSSDHLSHFIFSSKRYEHQRTWSVIFSFPTYMEKTNTSRWCWLIFNHCLAGWVLTLKIHNFIWGATAPTQLSIRKNICSPTLKKILFRVDLDQHFLLPPKWVEINEIWL